MRSLSLWRYVSKYLMSLLLLNSGNGRDMKDPNIPSSTPDLFQSSAYIMYSQSKAPTNWKRAKKDKLWLVTHVLWEKNNSTLPPSSSVHSSLSSTDHTQTYSDWSLSRYLSPLSRPVQDRDSRSGSGTLSQTRGSRRATLAPLKLTRWTPWVRTANRSLALELLHLRIPVCIGGVKGWWKPRVRVILSESLRQVQRFRLSWPP